MSQEIPEYYRHLAPSEKESEPEGSTPKEADVAEKQRGMPIPTRAKKQQQPPLPAFDNLYTANSFTLNLPDEWTDKTVFTLTGPVTDGIQHNITVTLQTDLPAEDILDFAAWQIRSLEDTLKGCRLLLRESIHLDNGHEAYRAIFVWWPTEDLRLYQEQLYVLSDKTGYTVTASFTKKTRKTLGPEIERAMLSFCPNTK